MISDNDINNYYTNNYDMLEKIANGLIFKRGRKNLDASLMISESFFHIKKDQHKIKTIKELQKFIIKFIRDNIRWENSQVNIKTKVNNNLEYILDYIEEDESDIELEQKLAIERWYIEKKCILEMYRTQEKDQEKRIIFDCFFKKGKNSGVKLAEHLNINKDYACDYIRVMKKDIKEFYNNIKNNN